jgi:hypothetical protein
MAAKKTKKAASRSAASKKLKKATTTGQRKFAPKKGKTRAKSLAKRAATRMSPKKSSKPTKEASSARKVAKQLKPSAARRFSLYWCKTPDGDEDWFVVSNTARDASRFHEDEEGYERGDARAERIVVLPAELHASGGWKDGPTGRISGDAGWPSDDLIVACGGEIARQPRGGLRDTMGVVCMDVRFGERVFRAGDVVTNLDRSHGIKEPRLSVFKGGKGE